jgi:hypothetical protein
MLRLRDGGTIWRASPEAALDQEFVQLKQRCERYAWGTQLHCRTSDGINHPGRGGNDMSRHDNEMNNAAGRALFAVLAAKLASEIPMPTVMDLDVLPNMGRMTPRWPSEGRTGSSLDQTGGERVAAIYTVIETCKVNGIDPQAYIADVTAKIAADWPASRRDRLLPWNWRQISEAPAAQAA